MSSGMADLGQAIARTMTQGALELPGLEIADTSDDWYTPRWIFDAAGIVFDMDVCAPVDPQRRTCPARRYLSPPEDGLTTPWEGVVWMNPPYSAPAPWVFRWAGHQAGLALVPAANSPWRAVLMSSCDGIALISVKTKGPPPMIGFGRADGTQVSYPVALILAAKGRQCVEALAAVSSRDPYSGAYHVRPGF